MLHKNIIHFSQFINKVMKQIAVFKFKFYTVASFKHSYFLS